MRFVAACCALVLTVFQPAAEPPPVQTFRLHFSPADRNAGRYQYVPFDLVPGTDSVTITYRYEANDGASVVDLGLFEPGPLALGSPAFRGYSGGAQRTITVGRETASPGYRAGEMPGGTWHVLLGLYKVAVGGVDVDVEIAAGGRSPVTRRWYSGALHLHTIHSDGSTGPAAVSALARAAGLDFIAITDHNNTFHAREAMPSTPLAIVGEEVTTPAGHANVWGLKAGSFIDFRVSPDEPGAADRIEALVGQAHAAGALFAINHPFGDCGGCSWQQAVPDGLDAVEIWNGEVGPQDAAVEMWDRRLQAGHRVTAIGASDWHRAPSRIDAAAVRVLASDLSERAILDGLRAGRAVVVRDARTAAPTVAAACDGRTAGVGDTLVCARGSRVVVTVQRSGEPDEWADLIVNGVRRGSQPIAEATFSVPAEHGYLRVTTHSKAAGAIALTNPIYVVAR